VKWWKNDAEVGGDWNPNGIGGFGTVQIGFDKQLNRRFVAGIFADYDFAAIDSKVTSSSFSQVYPKLTDSWTVGGRVGYLITPSALIYGLAGYTQAHFKLPQDFVLLATTRPLLTSDFSGWTVGAGMETNLGGSWYLKGEYRFTELGTETLYADPVSTYKITAQPDVHTGRVVLSYKLNGGGYDPMK
jgi:outer membrane immunogenic protein